ncbi:unnamed protein product [Urochloa humidicola]
MATPPPSEDAQGEQVAQEAGGQSMQTALGAEALRSMAEAKSLLVKRKAPTGKRRKAPIVNAQLLKRQRQLLSPRTSHSQPVRLTSPSVRGDGVPPTELEGSSSSSPPPLQGYTNFKMAEDIDDNEDQYYNEQI